MVKQTGHIDRQVGANILSLRLAKKMTRKSLAESVGVTHQQMQKYENGINRISVSRLLCVAEALNVHPCELIDENGLPDLGKNTDNKILSEIVGYLKSVNDTARLEAIRNLIKSMI